MKKLETHGIKDLALENLFSEQEWLERKRHIATLKNFAGASVAAAKALARSGTKSCIAHTRR